MTTRSAALLLSCPDQPGIVAAVADFLYRHGGNIVDAQQHTDRDAKVFFQRVVVELDGFDLGPGEVTAAMTPIIERFGIDCSVHVLGTVTRVGILVSREGHCMIDLLARARAGELPIDVPVVISNHPDHEELVRSLGTEYVHLPAAGAAGADRTEQEAAVDVELSRREIELLVLARYMRILSKDMTDRWSGRVINIHHSFLPAFAGPRPYHQAHARGVKIIGATAHYATAELDEGPIIAQDVAHVSHRHDVDDLRRLGRDLEVTVLAKAVRAHIDHRVLVHGRRTIVFD